MQAIIRDAPAGQLLRYLTGNKVLPYPEERPGFQCPSAYKDPDAAEKKLEAMRSASSTPMVMTPDEQADVEKAALEPAEPAEPVEPVEAYEPAEPVEDLNRVETSRSGVLHRLETAKDLEKSHTLKSTMSRVNTKSALSQAATRADLEEAFRAATIDLSKEPSRPIIPEKTADGTILVDWYTTDDPENPQNWSQGKKAVAALQICLYTVRNLETLDEYQTHTDLFILTLACVLHGKRHLYAICPISTTDIRSEPRSDFIGPFAVRPRIRTWAAAFLPSQRNPLNRP